MSVPTCWARVCALLSPPCGLAGPPPPAATARGSLLCGARARVHSLGLVVAWAAILCLLGQGDSPALQRQSVAHTVFISTFAFARVAHTVVYAFQLSYARSLAWFFGLLSVLSMGVNAIVAAFQSA